MMRGRTKFEISCVYFLMRWRECLKINVLHHTHDPIRDIVYLPDFSWSKKENNTLKWYFFSDFFQMTILIIRNTHWVSIEHRSTLSIKMNYEIDPNCSNCTMNLNHENGFQFKKHKRLFFILLTLLIFDLAKEI